MSGCFSNSDYDRHIEREVLKHCEEHEDLRNCDWCGNPLPLDSDSDFCSKHCELDDEGEGDETAGSW